jgi:hypothetical protein
MRWTGKAITEGKKVTACRILVGKPKGERRLGIPRRRRVDNIKMDLRDIEYGPMERIDLAQDRN